MPLNQAPLPRERSSLLFSESIRVSLSTCILELDIQQGTWRMGRPAELLSEAHTSPEGLEREHARLENAIRHLHRSNDELRQAQTEGDIDPELEEALQVGADARVHCI